MGGGGPGGLSTGYATMECGVKALVVDKDGVFSGNRTMATSELNGALTDFSCAPGIVDSPETFAENIMREEAGRSDLVTVLTDERMLSVGWLVQKFNLDLSLVHRGRERLPDVTITDALMEKLEEITKTSDCVRIRHKTQNIRSVLHCFVLQFQCKKYTAPRCSQNIDKALQFLHCKTQFCLAV